MSHRPIEQKKRRRVARTLRRRSLPVFFDLIQWLVDHEHAATKRAARAMILAKHVRYDSHPIGFKRLPVMKDGVTVVEDVVVERVPIAAKVNIVVSDV